MYKLYVLTPLLLKEDKNYAYLIFLLLLKKAFQAIEVKPVHEFSNFVYKNYLVYEPREFFIFIYKFKYKLTCEITFKYFSNPEKYSQLLSYFKCFSLGHFDELIDKLKNSF